MKGTAVAAGGAFFSWLFLIKQGDHRYGRYSQYAV